MNTIKSVCVVDDDLVYQFITRKLIEGTKMVNKIMVFSDGEEAIRFFQSITNNKDEDIPDIIFLDINMPVMDGWDFLKEYVLVKPRFSKKITIYMVSSSVQESDIQRANEISEVSGYIVKPITMDKLFELFEEYISKYL